MLLELERAFVRLLARLSFCLRIQNVGVSFFKWDQFQNRNGIVNLHIWRPYPPRNRDPKNFCCWVDFSGKKPVSMFTYGLWIPFWLQKRWGNQLFTIPARARAS